MTSKVRHRSFDVKGNPPLARGDSEQIFRNAFRDDPAVWAAASPMPTIPRARLAQSEELVTRLRDAAVPARLVRASGLTHEEVTRAVGDPDDTVVTPPLMDFFRNCLRA